MLHHRVPLDVARIAELEWLNYAATHSSAQAAPGLGLVMRDDAIITNSALFPLPDANHACRLRTTQDAADDLIAEIVAYFTERDVPPTVFVSPACQPEDWCERLKAHGFARQDGEEAWLVLDDLPDRGDPGAGQAVTLRRIGPADVSTFACTFASAFDAPDAFTGQLAQVLAPTVGLSDVYHFLMEVESEPVGVISLLTTGSCGVLGSSGVLPAHRRRGVAKRGLAEAIAQACALGLQTLIVQTEAGSFVERFVADAGFLRAFTRRCYVRS